jgi:hypothetical protein
MTSRKQEVYRVAKRTAIIDFAEDSPWHGVEATVITSVPFATLFWYQKNAEDSSVETSVEALKRFGDEFLSGWNLVDDAGKPYPATGDGVCAVDDSGLVTALMGGWIEAVVHPSAPLSGQSNGGGGSGEESTEALANLSQSLGS